MEAFLLANGLKLIVLLVVAVCFLVAVRHRADIVVPLGFLLFVGACSILVH